MRLIGEEGDLDVGGEGRREGYGCMKLYGDGNEYNVYEGNEENDIGILGYGDIVVRKCEGIVGGGEGSLGDSGMSLFNEIGRYV